MYWCNIGTTGRSTPIISPISRHQVPAALTMCSAMISPLSVVIRHSPPGFWRMAVTRCLPIDLGAAVARASRHRVGRLARVDMTVERFVNCADQIVDLGQRVDILEFARAQDMEIETGKLADTLHLAKLVEPVRRGGSRAARHRRES